MKDSDKVTLTVGQLKKLVSESKSNTWHGVPGTKLIWHGEWDDPEIEYDGETLNANKVEDFAWGIYVKDCEAEDKKVDENEFDNQPVKFFKDALDDYMLGMNESINEANDVIDNIYDQEKMLSEIIVLAKDAKYIAKKLYTSSDKNREYYENLYANSIKNFIKYVEQMKNFDVIALESKQTLKESTPEQVEVRERAAKAKANGEYYAIGYMDSSNFYPDFICSNKDKNKVLETAKEMMSEEDDGPYYETVNVCDPEGYIVKRFKSEQSEDEPYWGTEY